jgi:hypothetical protein
LNATVGAQPSSVNIAKTESNGQYALYFGNGGTYTLTASHDDFGALPPMYEVQVNGALTGVDIVLPPADEAISNGGWELGNLTGWSRGPGATSTVMIEPHTGHFSLMLEASGETLNFWPHVTQTISIPDTWSQPALSFMYRVLQGEPGDKLLAMISGDSTTLTHTVSMTPGNWVHTWRDLSALRGQTVTLFFGFQNPTSGQQIYLDEISVGESKVGAFSIYLPLILRHP